MSGPYDTEFFVQGRRLNRIGGSLSILGSSYIIQSVLRDPQKRKIITNQVVVALSVADFFASLFGNVLLQWVAPKGSAQGAIGNVGTCATSALLGGIGFLSSTYFNASLAITYLLIIKYGWKEERLQKNRIYLLGIPLLFTVPLVIAAIAMGGGNFSGLSCGATITEPPSCMGDPSTCIRGRKMAEHPLIFLIGATTQTVVSVPTVIGCMISLYLSVLKNEKRNDQYRFGGDVNREQSNRIAMQGIYYVWAFLAVEVVWVASVAMAFTQASPVAQEKFGASTSVIVPMQGFFNAMVYLRPSYLEYLRKNPEKTIPNCIRRLFGLEIQLPEQRHNKKNIKKKIVSNKSSSKHSNNDDDRYESSRYDTTCTFNGSTLGSFRMSSFWGQQWEQSELGRFASSRSTSFFVLKRQHGGEQQEDPKEDPKEKPGTRMSTISMSSSSSSSSSLPMEPRTGAEEDSNRSIHFGVDDVDDADEHEDEDDDDSIVIHA